MCCWSSYTWPAYIWSVLSILSAIVVGVSVYFSNWIQLEEADGLWSSMSPYRICANFSSQITIECVDYLSFDEMFSDWWRACTILVGAGACFLILVAITSVFGMLVPRLFSKIVTVLIAGVQFFGAAALIAVVFLFPVGFSAARVVMICRSDVYSLGRCSLGWTYILFIVGTALSIVAVTMSWTPIRTRKRSDSGDPIPYDS